VIFENNISNHIAATDMLYFDDDRPWL